MLKLFISATETVRRLRKDDEGAAFLEYTALLGIILALTIGTLIAVGGWADTVWDGLCTALGTTTLGGGCTPG